MHRDRRGGACRVKHIVYTSATSAKPNPQPSIAADHYATEQALAASSLGWTILRNNLHTEFLLRLLPNALATGQLVAAAGDGGVGYVTREDCARAAAAALSSSGSGRVAFDITGPAVVTHADLAKIASAISDRPVSYVKVGPGDLRKRLTAAGLPLFQVERLVSFDVGIAEGTLGIATNAVAELTGQAPTRVAEFLSAGATPFSSPWPPHKPKARGPKETRRLKECVFPKFHKSAD